MPLKKLGRDIITERRTGQLTIGVNLPEERLSDLKAILDEIATASNATLTTTKKLPDIGYTKYSYKFDSKEDQRKFVRMYEELLAA